MSQPPPGESWKVAPGLLGLGAVFCVARVHMVACFVCEQCSVAPDEGVPSPAEGSLTLLHSVWLRWLWVWCFLHRHAPQYGGPPLFLFWSFLIPRSQEFPHLEENSDRSEAANKMHLLLLMLPNLPMSVDSKFTDYSLFLLFFSTKQSGLISKTFSGLHLVESTDLVFSSFTNNSQQKTRFLLHLAFLVPITKNELYRDIYLQLVMTSIVILK